jgi:uncharacterized protein (DUF952 family)
MIYHYVTGTNWKKAQQQGFYTSPSWFTEGFIHASKKEQLAGVLQRYYTETPDLYVLHIDEQKLTAPLKWELSPSLNELFPHIYGELNLDAVVDISAVQ